MLSIGINVELHGFQNGLACPEGPVRIHANIVFFADISPQGNFRRSFIQNNSFTIELLGRFARDNTDFYTAVLFIKVLRQYAVLKGKIIYVDKRGANPQVAIKLNHTGELL